MINDKTERTLSENTTITIRLLGVILTAVVGLGVAAGGWGISLSHKVDMLQVSVNASMKDRFTSKDGLVIFTQLSRDNPDLVVSPIVFEILGDDNE